MNKAYKSVWNESTGTWTAAPETARSAGGGGSSRAVPVCLALLLAVGAMPASAGPPAAPPASQLPTGGQLAAGSAQIAAPAGNTLNVTQGSQRAVINWQSFSIGSAATVNFRQPDASSVTLNRVLSSDPSQIFGSLNANGSVYIVNPNGVLFSPTAQVNVGGLVASTMGITNDDFMAGRAVFGRNGSTAAVINQGQIRAGAYIALLAPEVRNEGVLIAQAGTVALAAGERITLNFGEGSRLQSIAVTPAQIRTLVENRHAVLAEGGQIILSSRAAEGLLGSVVNSGTLNAGSITDKGGVITIEADSITLAASSRLNADGIDGGRIQVGSMQSRVTEADGTLSARGSSGAGGSIETSAQQLKLGAALAVDTTGSTQTGQWLLDPYDLTVGSTDASTIGTNLASTNVTLQTSAGGTSGPGTANAAGSGDITINSAISWSSANTLTLDAYRNININATIAAGNTGKVVLVTGDTASNGTSGSATGDYSFGLSSAGFAGKITFGSTAGSASLKIASGGGNAAQSSYTLVYTQANLAAINGQSGNYALANSLSTSGTYTAGTPGTTTMITSFGSSSTHAGSFTGLGNTLSGFTIKDTPGSNTNGPGGYTLIGTNYGTIRDFGVVGASITTSTFANSSGSSLMMGAVVGGTVRNDYVTGTISMTNSGNVGGLVGNLAYGTVDNSWSSASVSTGSGTTGGLIGVISSSGAGNSKSATVSNSYATGAVTSTGGSQIGGLIGSVQYNNPTNDTTIITNSYATGNVSTVGSYVGGLIGSPMPTARAAR